MRNFPQPPVIDALGKSLSVLNARPSLPGQSYSYQIGGNTYGLDSVISNDLDIDESRMSVWVPFANGARRDGVGDLLEVGGIRTERHRVNPIILWNHAKEISIPIALAEDRDTKEYTVVIDPTNQVAKACCYFYGGTGIKGVDRSNEYQHALFCEQIFDMLCKRLVRSGSIGYQVVQAQPLPPDPQRGVPRGLHLLSVNMLEASVVVLPANQDTVRKSIDAYESWQESVTKLVRDNRLCGKELSPVLYKSLVGAVEMKSSRLPKPIPKPHKAEVAAVSGSMHGLAESAYGEGRGSESFDPPPNSSETAAALHRQKLRAQLASGTGHVPSLQNSLPRSAAEEKVMANGVGQKSKEPDVLRLRRTNAADADIPQSLEQGGYEVDTSEGTPGRKRDVTRTVQEGSFRRMPGGLGGRGTSSVVRTSGKRQRSRHVSQTEKQLPPTGTSRGGQRSLGAVKVEGAKTKVVDQVQQGKVGTKSSNRLPRKLPHRAEVAVVRPSDEGDPIHHANIENPADLSRLRQHTTTARRQLREQGKLPTGQNGMEVPNEKDYSSNHLEARRDYDNELSNAGRRIVAKHRPGLGSTYQSHAKELPSDRIKPKKACQILHDGEANGHALTPKQEGMFGAACGRKSLKRKLALKKKVSGSESKPAETKPVPIRNAQGLHPNSPSIMDTHPPDFRHLRKALREKYKAVPGYPEGKRPLKEPAKPWRNATSADMESHQSRTSEPARQRAARENSVEEGRMIRQIGAHLRGESIEPYTREKYPYAQHTETEDQRAHKTPKGKSMAGRRHEPHIVTTIGGTHVRRGEGPPDQKQQGGVSLGQPAAIGSYAYRKVQRAMKNPLITGQKPGYGEPQVGTATEIPPNEKSMAARTAAAVHQAAQRQVVQPRKNAAASISGQKPSRVEAKPEVAVTQPRKNAAASIKRKYLGKIGTKGPVYNDDGTVDAASEDEYFDRPENQVNIDDHPDEDSYFAEKDRLRKERLSRKPAATKKTQSPSPSNQVRRNVVNLSHLQERYPHLRRKDLRQKYHKEYGNVEEKAAPLPPNKPNNRAMQNAQQALGRGGEQGQRATGPTWRPAPQKPKQPGMPQKAVEVSEVKDLKKDYLEQAHSIGQLEKQVASLTQLL